MNTTKDLNSLRGIVAIQAIHVIGAGIIVIVPAFVHGLVSYLGYSEVEAGYITTGETAGMAAGSLLMMLLVTRVNWRLSMRIGLVLFAMGNLLSNWMGSTELLIAARVISGTGGGMVVALSYATFGVMRNPERMFGLCMVLAALYAAVMLAILPYLYDLGGMSVLYFIIAGLCLIALSQTGLLPDFGSDLRRGEQGAPVPIGFAEKFIAPLSILFYFISWMAVFTYIFLIGISAGLGDKEVSMALAASNFFGMAGALTVTLLGDRYRRIYPIIIAGVLAIVAIAGLTPASFGLLWYGMAVCLFGYSTWLLHPYLLAVMAGLDPSSRIITYATFLQYIGTAVGPLAAATLLGAGNYSRMLQVSALLFLLCLACIVYPYLNARRQGTEARF